MIENSQVVNRASQPLEGLRDFFAKRRVAAYLVGGFVRDYLLKKTSGDIDLAVAGPALELAREVAGIFGGHYVVMDEENEIARVVLKGDNGGDWHVDISTMHGSIEEDLALRDFTIDAMALELCTYKGAFAESEIIDPFGGRRDLGLKLVRAISEGSLERDPLRLLRAVRLAAELGFEIEPNTADLIRRHCQLITSVSAERVRDELYRIIAAPRAASWLSRLDELGLLTPVIPELEASKGVRQPKEHCWDVFHHSLETVAAIEYLIGRGATGGLWQFGENLLAPVPWFAALRDHFNQEVCVGRNRLGLLKLVALLHDIAKPLCKTIDEGGRIRFFGHAKEGAAIAARVMERLRFSSREIELASRAIKHHLRPGAWGEELPTHRAIYRFYRDTGDGGVDVIFLNLADHLATRGPLLALPEWQQHARAAGYVLAKYFEEKSIVTPPKLVDGHLLMEHFKLPPGRIIGQLLEAIREAQAAGDISTREEALAFASKLLPHGVRHTLAQAAQHHTSA